MPRAKLLTLVHVPGTCDRHIERMPIVTSFLNALPGVGRYYRYLLPVMPLAMEWMNAERYDLIISCSHCVAKGVIRRPGSAHACYCFTPMRYVWAQDDAYGGAMGLPGLALRASKPYLRAWDLRSARHVDRFMANSRNVAGRIRRTYGREADVVYSPIDTDFLTPDGGPREDFYLMVTALAPYKRADQAVEAFARLGRPLRVIGSGQQLEALRKSRPPNVELLGWQSDEVVREHYRRCRALVFPGEEDFGLVPLEAMACGAPVIAYGAGGALETVLDAGTEGPDGPTGLLYAPQTVDALVAAVEKFERTEHVFHPRRLSAWARRFGPERFIEDFKRSLRQLLAAKGLGEPWSNDTGN
jgi:glycosyltransferase involved in cell wall biosynthesis